MITFHETVDIVGRLAEMLKSASELEVAINDTTTDLASFLTMLEFSHTKDFKGAEDALQYIDTVLIPQILGIRDSLTAGTNEHLKRLNTARDLTERVIVRLRMLDNGSFGDFLG
jgi:hypothetical protein